jgi:hypothetical protein
VDGAQAGRAGGAGRDLAQLRRAARVGAGDRLFHLRLRLLVLRRGGGDGAGENLAGADARRAPGGARAASSAAFLASVGLQRLLAPEWFAIFAFRAGSVDERGPSNPALLSLFRDLFPEAGLALALWAAAVLVVVFLSVRTLRRTKADMRLRIMLAALTYALIAPRFKDYSYELLLPVGLHLVQRVPLAALICFPVGRGVKIVSVIGRYLERYYPRAGALRPAAGRAGRYASENQNANLNEKRGARGANAAARAGSRSASSRGSR